MEQGWLCGGAGLGWVWIWASIYRYYRYFELVFGAFLDLDLGRDLVLIRDRYWFLALVFFFFSLAPISSRGKAGWVEANILFLVFLVWCGDGGLMVLVIYLGVGVGVAVRIAVGVDVRFGLGGRVGREG